MGKRIVSLDNQKAEFQPQNPRGMRYLIFDTACQTGKHLADSIEKIRAHDKEVAGVVFVTMNDMLRGGVSRRNSVVAELHRDGKLIYCFDMSYLYTLAEEQLIEIASQPDWPDDEADNR